MGRQHTFWTRFRALRRPGTATLALALWGSARAQVVEDRAHVLSHFDPGASAYNDIWGYRHSSGREIAILGAFNGTYFVETTDPQNPVQLKFISRASSSWGDMETLGDVVYIGTEGGGGLQVVDVSNPDNITLVKSVTTFFQTTHNVRVDKAAAKLYAPGSNNSMPVLNLSNPLTPTLDGTYTVNYVHDISVQNGFGFSAEIYAGVLAVLNVSTPGTFTVLDSITTPGAFTHNSWPSPDNTLVVTTDEVVGGHWGLYDVSNKSNIVPVSEYTPNPSAITHNAYILNDRIYASSYSEGFWCVDITDPVHPDKIAQVDTFAGPDGNFDGAWGCYPFQPSGNVYLSDIATGLYVISLGVQIQHTALTDTQDPTGPFPVVASITPTNTSAVTAADLHYTTDGTNFTTTAMTPGGGNTWSASIPGQAAGSTVQYFLTAADGFGSGRWPVNPGQNGIFHLGSITTHYFNDFEGATDEGWTHGAVAGSDDWQRGTSAGRAEDPFGAYSGTRAWGNDLGGAGFNGFYTNNANIFLRSPSIDLSGVSQTRLRLRRWLTVEQSTRDVASITVNGTEVWRNSASAELEDDGWVLLDLDVSAVADGVASTTVQFNLVTNGGTARGGWNVDDVELYSVSGCSAVNYGAGTAGTGGIVPTITTSGGLPTLGNVSHQVDVGSLRGGVFCGTFLGLARDSLNVHGIQFLVKLSPFYLLFFNTASGAPGAAGAGSFSLPFPIPADPGIVGLELDVQTISVDPAGPQGWAASPGLAITICAP